MCNYNKYVNMSSAIVYLFRTKFIKTANVSILNINFNKTVVNPTQQLILRTL